MSLATLGAVSLTTNDLPLPDTSALSLGEALILSGGGGTTEAVVIRSIASGRNIGVTVNRGALGTLRLAHTAPTTVSVYDPSGGGSGSGVTVEVPPAAPVAVTNIVAAGASVSGSTATLGVTQYVGPYHVAWNTAGLDPDAGSVIAVGPELDAGTCVVLAWYFVTAEWIATDPATLELFVLVGDSNATSAGMVDRTGGYLSPQTTHGGQWVPSADASLPLDQTGLDNIRLVRAGPFLVTGANVRLRFGVYGPGLSAGAADIYAILAIPA